MNVEIRLQFIAKIFMLYEPRRKKTCLSVFQLCKGQTNLLNNRDLLE